MEKFPKFMREVYLIDTRHMLTLVEKVFFLQDIDIFKNTMTEDLSHIASITEELTFKRDTDIFQEGDISDSLFILIEGKVRLHRGGEEVMIAGKKDVFGTWALFDDEPRVVTATTLDECLLLRLHKEDFYDLLADHSQITKSILKNLSMRLRNLMQRINVTASSPPSDSG
jgi:CRP-like cAMP-binding protein